MESSPLYHFLSEPILSGGQRRQPPSVRLPMDHGRTRSTTSGMPAVDATHPIAIFHAAMWDRGGLQASYCGSGERTAPAGLDSNTEN